MNAGNEGPKRSDFRRAAALPDCGDHCVDIHGDQAFSERELEEMREARGESPGGFMRLKAAFERVLRRR